MGTTERRQREKEMLRQKMLDAARDIFVTQGYEAVTMRRIAEKIDYSPTAIYSYFKDKDALLRAVSDADLAELSWQLQQIECPDPVEHLRLVAHAYVKFGMENPSQYRLLFMNVVEPRLPAEEATERNYDAELAGYSILLNAVTDMVRGAGIDLQGRDPAMIAQILWSAVHGLVSLQVAMDKEPWMEWTPINQRVDLMFDLLMGGLSLKA